MTVPAPDVRPGARAGDGDIFAAVRGVADAVLYEGYSLYPYRASAPKNLMRWQFGVLVPPDYQDTAEPSSQLTECVVEGDDDTRMRLAVRFLHLQARTVEARGGDGAFVTAERLDTDDGEAISWDEGVEHVVELEARLGDLLAAAQTEAFCVEGSREEETLRHGGAEVGRFVRVRHPLDGVVEMSARRAAADRPAFVVRVVVENRTPWERPGVPRSEAMQASFVGVHTMMAVEDGA
ncbi:MAG TPA: hypothetical protein VM618_02035, partial [Acidimicrobiia bacterium]|nr:hypothetical protein [Acidimicrobiia bacterium]